MSLEADVLIVGSGPVGLWLALELRSGGLDVLVIDSLLSSDRSPHSKALILGAGSIETFHTRGVAQPFLDQGSVLPVAHFGALPTMLDLNEKVLGLRHSYNLTIAQSRTEAILLAKCEASGVRFAWGLQFISLVQDERGVTSAVADLSHHEQGQTVTREIFSRWLVGCDGVRSAVRQAAGIAFTGSPGTLTGTLADVQMSSRFDSKFLIHFGSTGSTLITGTGDGVYYRIVYNSSGPKKLPQTPTMDEVCEHLRSTFGTDFGAHSPAWLSRFGGAIRLPSSLRAGKVFLAGDAAHQFYPAGGQGMNVGIQDATNLAWKVIMASNIMSRDPITAEKMLETYQRERLPALEDIVHNVRAQMALMNAEGEYQQAFREWTAEALTNPQLNKLWALRVTGFGEPRQPYCVMETGDDALVGTRITHLGVGENGEELHRRCRVDRFVLLLRAGNEAGGAIYDELENAIEPWTQQVTVLRSSTMGSHEKWDNVNALLVRPDMRVAWARRTTEQSQVSLVQVLNWWFGDGK